VALTSIIKVHPLGWGASAALSEASCIGSFDRLNPPPGQVVY